MKPYFIPQFPSIQFFFPLIFLGSCSSFYYCAINQLSSAKLALFDSSHNEKVEKKKKMKAKTEAPHVKKKQQQMLYIKWIVHNQKVKVEPRKLVSSHRLDARAVSDLTCLWNQGREDQWAMLQLVQFRKTFAIVDTSNKCNSWVTLAQRNINGWGSAGRLKPSLWVSTCVSMCIFKRVVFFGGAEGLSVLAMCCTVKWNNQ